MTLGLAVLLGPHFPLSAGCSRCAAILFSSAIRRRGAGGFRFSSKSSRSVLRRRGVDGFVDGFSNKSPRSVLCRRGAGGFSNKSPRSVFRRWIPRNYHRSSQICPLLATRCCGGERDIILISVPHFEFSDIFWLGWNPWNDVYQRHFSFRSGSGGEVYEFTPNTLYPFSHTTSPRSSTANLYGFGKQLLS